MKELTLHIERLRRHYQSSVHTYDQISLVELSHALRMWVDLKKVLPTINSKFESSVSFSVTSPTRKLLKIVANSDYLFCYTPEKILTFASNGDYMFTPIDETKKGVSAGVTFKMIENGGVEMQNFSFYSGVLDEDIAKKMPLVKHSRVNFINWLGADVVRYKFNNHDGRNVKCGMSREMLIKRIANTMDGSHPSVVPNDEFENQFDSHVKYLMGFRWGGIPLPYFVLLHAAQVILNKVSANGLCEKS